MISSETELKIAEIFFQIIYFEDQVEENRKSLNNNLGFDPYNSFEYLDYLKIGSISSFELQSFLNKHSIFTNNTELNLLIKQYDFNLDGRLSIEEYFSMVLSSTNNYLKELALNNRGFLSSEAEMLLVKLIASEIQYHRNLENARIGLINQKDFSLSKAYKRISLNGPQGISAKLLWNYLKKFQNITDVQIDSIFRRIDNDGDMILNYKEFVDAIMPSKIENFIKENYKSDASEINVFHTLNNKEISVRNVSPLRKKNLLAESDSVKTKKTQENFRSTSINSKTSQVHEPSKKIGDWNEHFSSKQQSNLLQPTFSSTMRSSRETLRYQPSPLKIDQKIRKQSPLENAKTRKKSNSKGKKCQTFRESLKSEKKKKLNDFTDSTLSLSSLKNSCSKPSPIFNHNKGHFNIGNSKDFYINSNVSNEEKELVAWFQDEIKISRQIERLKNDLALKNDFNLVGAFRLFDQNNSGFIGLKDLEKTFDNSLVYFSKQDLTLLINRFSKSTQNETLQFSDFAEILAPKQEDYLRILANKSPLGFENFQSFSKATMNLFFDIFKMIIEAENLAEKVRLRLSKMPEFSFRKAFIVFDQQKKGFFTISELKTILHSHGVFATGKDLELLISKYDKKNEGKVSFPDFVQEMTPKSIRN